MAETWVLIVPSERFRSRQIRLIGAPRASSIRTSFCRSVR
ncbi:hypothetical protein EVA_12474 [gut metagenome]|uniref:Uncharacterized protein n=1 Tax=gut metagenome TaxID=749906 RepID=J9FXY5_9ZZZZ